MKGGERVSEAMLPESQARVLRLLARHPKELESAWDVPRELSLPGLADSLGLVRSALHAPLKALEEAGLVQTRTAHVIGGGRRKRSVVHLTDEGRRQATGLVAAAGLDIEVESDGCLHGREVELDALVDALAKGRAVISGMPGIGKTALLEALPSARHVRLDSTFDAQTLTGAWLGTSDPPASLEAQVALLSELDDILVADELESVHERHRARVIALLEALPRVAVGVRAPAPFEGAITLQGLDAEAARRLLGAEIDVDTAAAVSTALDGHPLALHLWSPEDALPEAGDAVQAFVRDAVLARLDVDAREALDALSSEPHPVSAEDAGDLDLDALDDAALLRWPEGRVEVQHLVRNVLRVSWEDASAIHAARAVNWATVDGAEARRLEAHHRLLAGEDISAFVEAHADQVLEDTAAGAALLEDALSVLPDAQALRRMAARLALDRGEAEHAAGHMRLLQTDDHVLRARLHRTNGELEAAEAAEAAALNAASPAEAARMHLSRIAGAVDDRLPGTTGDVTAVERALADVSFQRLEADRRRAAIVLIAMLRHRLALLRGDGDTAVAVRRDLAELAGGEDPLIERLAHLEALRLSDADGAARLQAEGAMRRLVQRTADAVQRVSLGLALVEAQAASNPPGATATLEALQAVPLPLDQAAGRRLDALRWYWRGELEPDRRLACWREAALRFRRAECPRAAKALTARLHRAL